MKDNDHRPQTMTDVGDDGEHGPDALTHGDWIVLRVTAESGESPVTGHLCGDGGAMRLGLQTAGDMQEHRDALNFHDFVFQVVPALNYRQVRGCLGTCVLTDAGYRRGWFCFGA